MKLSEEQKTILKECKSTSLSATDNARKLLSRHRLFMSTFNQTRIQMMQECQMQLISASCDVRDFAEKESFIKDFNISKLQNDFANHSFKSKYVGKFFNAFKAALLSDDAADGLECVDIKFSYSYTDYHRGRFDYGTYDKKTGLDAYIGQSFTVRLFSEKLQKHIDVIIPIAKNIRFKNEDDLYSETIGRYVIKIGAECQLNNTGYSLFDEIDAKEIIDNDKQRIFPLTCICWKLNECKAALNEILSFDYSKDKKLLINKLADESTSNVVIESNECCDIVNDVKTGKFEYETYDLKRISKHERMHSYPWETNEEDDPFAFDYISKHGYISLDHYMMDKFVQKLLEGKPAKLVERCMEKMINNPDSVNIREDIIKQKEKDN